MGTSRSIFLGIILAYAGPIAALSAAPDEIKNSACLECHSDKTLFKTNAAGQALSLFIDEPRFLKAVHKTNTCATCHSDLTVKHPDDNVPAKRVNCASCHGKEAGEYAASIH